MCAKAGPIWRAAGLAALSSCKTSSINDNILQGNRTNLLIAAGMSREEGSFVKSDCRRGSNPKKGVLSAGASCACRISCSHATMMLAIFRIARNRTRFQKNPGNFGQSEVRRCQPYLYEGLEYSLQGGKRATQDLSSSPENGPSRTDAQY